MSPAAQEMIEAAPGAYRFREERILVSVVLGVFTAREGAKRLTPYYMDDKDEGVRKIERAALEDIEFYRDLVHADKKHDKSIFREIASQLRDLWDIN